MELSVVIPSFRSERTIKRTIASAIAEGVAPENVIVVEDGVFDETASVVASCKGVRLITLDKNSGAPSARNVGLENVSTKYVMFLDADDYVEDGLLQGLILAIEQEHSDIAIGPWRYDGEGFRRCVTRTPEKLNNVEWIFSWIRLRFFPPCSVVWNANSIRRIGAWDEQLRTNDDGEIMIRAFLRDLTVSVSNTGNAIYWQHASPYRVSIAKVDDLLHATEVIFKQLETWAMSDTGKDFPESYRNALGRYCCVTAWHAFASDKKESGMQWMAKARAYGFRGKGYNYKTSFLAAFLGFRLSSKIRVRADRFRTLYKQRSLRTLYKQKLQNRAMANSAAVIATPRSNRCR